jgi:NDP-sugar pyrophosphorylase family protein
MMQAVVLAAGRGSRMGYLTKNTPKSLIQVLNKPLIDYVLEALPDEVDEYIIVIGYLGFQISSYVGSQYKGRRIHYVEQRCLGTAGGLFSARSLL